MKTTNQRAIFLDSALDAVCQTGEYNRAVTSALSANKFKVADAVDANTQFIELVEKEYMTSLKVTKEETQQYSKTEKETFSADFNEYLNSHSGFAEFLETEIDIVFKPIYLPDLEKCKKYNPNFVFKLRPEILKEEKKKVKASSK